MSNSPAEQRTIKHLAGSARQNGRHHYGDAVWTRMCVEFNQGISEGNEYNRYIDVMIFIAEVQTDGAIQQGYVWLDDHGFGDKSIEWFSGELSRVRMGLGL